MALPDAAVGYYQQQQQIGLSTLALARRVWSQLGPGDFDQAWQGLGPQLTVVLSAGQRASALSGVAFVPAVLDEMGVAAEADATVSVGPLVGVASDGRPLGSLLYQPVIRTRTALGDGASLDEALSSGGYLLDNIVSTQTADAARAAVSVASYVRPMVQGYIRMCNSGCCPRCAVLAGKFTFNETAFLRHTNCRCFNTPVDTPERAKDFPDARSLIEAGEVRGLSQADTQAIVEDGADPARVINAHKGMSTEQLFGQKVKTTSALSGEFGPVRLRPESILKLADDRAHTLELLAKFGYITN